MLGLGDKAPLSKTINMLYEFSSITNLKFGKKHASQKHLSILAQAEHAEAYSESNKWARKL